jgi:hypothetical protein
MAMAKLSMMIKCTSVVAHFDGLANVLVLCGLHRPMQRVQGYSGSHLMPPLGEYSLCFVPAAARAQLMWLSGRPMLLVAEVRGSIPAKHRGWSRR